jgi:hypothetical protein
MTVYLVISLPTIPYIHRIYMVLANPMYVSKSVCVNFCACVHVCVCVCVCGLSEEYLQVVG